MRKAILALLLVLARGSALLAPPTRHAVLQRRPRAVLARPCFMAASAGERSDGGGSSATDPLPPTLLPITLSVFVQLLGEGIAISSLPLHMTTLGASTVEVGLATSCFSVAQMVMCPVLVSLSSRVGRALVLRVCLAGATASSLLIAASGNTAGILVGRFCAGVFAASVPVAQAAATDIVKGPQTARALSRVSAASQAGVVIGPAASALLMSVFGMLGVPGPLRLRAAFLASAALALVVLAASISPQGRQNALDVDTATTSAPARSGDQQGRVVVAAPPPPPPSPPPAPPPPQRGVLRVAQPLLRLLALLVGWSLTLSVSTYGLFAPRILGFAQPQLSATYSAGAALTILVQLAVFPRLVARLGEHVVASSGALMIALGLTGTSLIKSPLPLHTFLYLFNRAGSGMTDTATATMVARASRTKDERSRNLGLIQSTRAGARIVTPILGGELFRRSADAAFAPGALPYLANSLCVLAVAPIPLLLRRAERMQKDEDAAAEAP